MVVKPKFINVTDNPIIIVGERIAKQRPGSPALALVGNRTGDFVEEAVGDRENIILTNIVNTLYSGAFRHDHLAGQGVLELIELIETYKPSKIITLGGIAKEYVSSIKIIDCPVFAMNHPSWINRFHSKLRDQYIKLLSNELDKRIPANT